MRVDVSVSPEDGEGKKRVDIWQTFRGNEWDNKGEKLGGGTLGQGGVKVNVGVLAERKFYEVRQGCELFPPCLARIVAKGLG